MGVGAKEAVHWVTRAGQHLVALEWTKKEEHSTQHERSPDLCLLQGVAVAG